MKRSRVDSDNSNNNNNNNSADLVVPKPCAWMRLPNIIADQVLKFVTLRAGLHTFTLVCQSWNRHSLRGGAWDLLNGYNEDGRWLKSINGDFELWGRKVGTRIHQVRFMSIHVSYLDFLLIRLS